jgi:hypothetical protein
MKSEESLARYLSERKVFQRKVVQKDVLQNVVSLHKIVKGAL